MRPFLDCIIVTAFISFNAFSQSEALQQQIELDKQGALNKGYSLLDSGGGKTSYDWVLTYDVSQYHPGGHYYAVAYFEGCSSCDVGLYFENTSTGQVSSITPKIERASGVIRATYTIQQSSTAYGNLSWYAKSNSTVYTYSMLFRKY